MINKLNVFNQLPGFVFYKNIDSVYLGCNQAMATLVGLKHPKSIAGKVDAELFKNNILVEQYLADDVLTLNQGYLTTLERTQDRNGRLITVLTNKQLYCDKAGKAMGIIVQASIVPPTITHSLYSRKAVIGAYKGLTSKESEVIYYLMQGYTAKNIAITLTCSYRTVEKHIENIKNKLCLNNKKAIFEYVKAYHSNSILASLLDKY